MKKLMLLGGLRYLLPVIELAHKRGYYVITVDYLPDNVAHKYSDEYYNLSTFDKDGILAVAKQLNINGIMSFAVDAGVTTAAYVAEKMGLPFQCSYKSACILQDKSLFRQFLTDNGFNAPKARGYDRVEDALRDIDYFTWPVMVKPVDSCGSKGVTKVENRESFLDAITTALNISVGKHFVVEEFLDVVGYQSSADVFAVDGKLVYPAYSDQLFDKCAANPYTPAIEIWPSSMPVKVQEDLNSQLQRLFSLLEVRDGLFNVESRLCSDGKAYLMEVSPRAGGNRIAELQTLATGQNLIAAELDHIMGEQMPSISAPVYEGVWCNYIIHSDRDGVLKSIDVDECFKRKYVRNEGYIVQAGDTIRAFNGANNSLGTIFLRADSREEMDLILSNLEDNVRVNLM